MQSFHFEVTWSNFQYNRFVEKGMQGTGVSKETS